MAIKRYSNGAWSDIGILRRYDTTSNTFIDCDSAKAYKGNAWVDVWSNAKAGYYYRAYSDLVKLLEVTNNNGELWARFTASNGLYLYKKGQDTVYVWVIGDFDNPTILANLEDCLYTNNKFGSGIDRVENSCICRFFVGTEMRGKYPVFDSATYSSKYFYNNPSRDGVAFSKYEKFTGNYKYVGLEIKSTGDYNSSMDAYTQFYTDKSFFKVKELFVDNKKYKIVPISEL